ncbi:RanBP2-type zinc finger protein [Ananas comosus]|uniref:RanBP2-type zinc finger protein n=1 Tax=Ananas comosus TaxID=4615 RepID=A0A199UT76_ANACO|nr:RanBP2-type zinc finger protein [Ananas comosus]
MSQVDNRNSSAGKRARTDGGRREDDWTCPSCGNVNFSFRTTCNMRNCTQSRPADHNTKPAPKHFQTPPPYTSSAAYIGSGTPSSMYLGASPYSSTLYNGPAMPRYDLPFSGGSAYPYSYGSRFQVGSPGPYGPIHLSGPPPYSGGSMMGAGGMYGVPPLVDRYGLGLHMGHGAMGVRPGPYPDDGVQKKASGVGRDNDWVCPNCGNNNFSFRNICNMRKCNTPRPGSQGSKSEVSKGSMSPRGSRRFRVVVSIAKYDCLKMLKSVFPLRSSSSSLARQILVVLQIVYYLLYIGYAYDGFCGIPYGYL